LEGSGDWDYCFKCCSEYGTSEPCPDCDCSFLDYDDELWDWEDWDEEV